MNILSATPLAQYYKRVTLLAALLMRPVSIRSVFAAPGIKGKFAGSLTTTYEAFRPGTLESAPTFSMGSGLDLLITVSSTDLLELESCFAAGGEQSQCTVPD